MKTLIFSLYLLLFSHTANAFEQDKIKHFTATAAISSSVYMVSRKNNISKPESIALGILAANIVGLLKEMNDPRFDKRDISANVFGSFFGVGFVWTFE